MGDMFDNCFGFDNYPIEKKATIILDLDNTLIFSDFEKVNNYQLTTYYRPHLKKFLSSISKYANLAIFTAGTQDYAEKIIENILKLCNYKIEFTQKLFRHNCTESVLNSGLFYKNLSQYFNLDRAIILDDNMDAVSLNLDNSFIVKPFYGEPDDNYLLEILPSILDFCKAEFLSGKSFINLIKTI